MIWAWLLGRRDDLGHVAGWDWRRQQHAEAVTEHMLLGAAGPAQVVGSRTVDRREAIVARRRAQEATQREVVRVWRRRA